MTSVASFVKRSKNISPLFHPLNQKTAATAFTVTLLLQLRVLVHSSPLLRTTNEGTPLHLPVNESSNNNLQQVPNLDTTGNNGNVNLSKFHLRVLERSNIKHRTIRSAGTKTSLFLPPSDTNQGSNSQHSSSGSSYHLFNSNIVSHLNSASIPSHSLITGGSGSVSSGLAIGSNPDSYFDSWTQQTKYPYYFAVHELLPHNLTVVLIKWQPLPAIRVSWDFDPQLKCDAFRVLYHPIASKYRYIVEVPCSIKNITIERLLPNTEYILTVNPVPAPAPVSLISTTSIHQHQHHQQQQQQQNLQAGQVQPNLLPDSSTFDTSDHSNRISDGKTIKQGQNYHLSNSKGSTSNLPPSSSISSSSSSSSSSSPASSSFSPSSQSSSSSQSSQHPPHPHPQYSHKYWLTHPNQYTSNIGRGPMISPPNVIRFISPQVEFNRFSSKFRSSSLIVRRPDDHFDSDSSVVVVKTGELAVVLFVLSGWILMIVIFVKKWGKIRGIETVSSFNGPNVGSVLAFPTSSQTNSVNVVNGANVPTNLVPFSVSNSGALRAQRSRESDESNSNEVSVSGIIATSATATITTGQMAGSIKKKRLEEAIHQFLMSHQQLKQSSVTSAPIQCKSSCSNSSYEQQQPGQGPFVRSIVTPRTVKSQENAPRSACYIYNCRCISPHYEHRHHNRWSCLHASRIRASTSGGEFIQPHENASSPTSPSRNTGNPFNDRHRSSLDHLDVYFTQSNIKSTSSDELNSVRDPRMNRSAENLLQLDFDM